MPVVSMLLFFGTFMFIVWAVFSIYLTCYNRKTSLARDKFIKEAIEFNPVVFYNIKLRYWTSSGQRTQVSPYNLSDPYFFSDCIVIKFKTNLVLLLNVKINSIKKFIFLNYAPHKKSSLSKTHFKP